MPSNNVGNSLTTKSLVGSGVLVLTDAVLTDAVLTGAGLWTWADVTGVVMGGFG